MHYGIFHASRLGVAASCDSKFKLQPHASVQPPFNQPTLVRGCTVIRGHHGGVTEALAGGAVVVAANTSAVGSRSSCKEQRVAPAAAA